MNKKCHVSMNYLLINLVWVKWKFKLYLSNGPCKEYLAFFKWLSTPDESGGDRNVWEVTNTG